MNDKQKSASTPPARTAAEAGAGGVYSTASKRRYGPGRKLLYAIATPLVNVLLRALRVTISIRVRSAPDAPEALDELRALTAGGGPCLPCIWHRHLMPAAGFLLGEKRHGLRACWLISPSLDAEVPARIAHRFGFAVVRGSGTRTGLRALLALRRAVVDERASAVLTPDGPKGPPCIARAGPVKLAQLTGAPMLPVGVRIRGAKRLGSWDRLEIPLPFARIDVVVGRLIPVATDVDAEGIEAGRARLEAALNELDRLAAGAAGA